MIAACYSMDLYCDVAGCRTNHIGGGLVPSQFTGRTWTDVAKQARRAGWLIGKDKSTAICPRCREAGKKLKDVPQEPA